ncbi:MAG: DUF1573 domain-containing protein [Planctomycetaceae bacterium]|jgi:hypothetical protein|nr:DUF1573 domain-containing protein [Planctomycetaceae bacterium]
MQKIKKVYLIIFSVVGILLGLLIFIINNYTGSIHLLKNNIDLGYIDNNFVEYEITLVNDSHKLYKILGAASDCGCVYFVDKPKTIHAQNTVQLKIKIVNTQEFPSDFFHKIVIYVEEEGTSKMYFLGGEIKGHFQQSNYIF